MNKNNGGPAFPVRTSSPAFYGMTLRDYFAAKAMQGCCAQGNGSLGGDGSPKAVACWAYEIADAMIAEREKNS